LDSPERVDWKEGIPLGITGEVDGVRTTVDESLYYGGLGRGHICLIQASAKMGKSTLMSNIALYQALRGYRVLIYSLELDTDYIGHRLCQLLSETPSEEYQKTDKRVIKQLIQERIAAYQSKGSLDWFHYPAQEISPSKIDMDLTVLSQKRKKPDVIIVDYMDLLRPDSHFKEYRLQLGQIMVGLRRVATSHDICVITATQSNRQARKLGSDSSNISEDFSKVQTTDLHITLNEIVTETTNGDVRNYFVTIENNRFGQSGIRIHLDQADVNIARFFNV
jgi:replicative DNA helicase